MTNLLDIITPINLQAEKEKFLASSTYDPQFHYFWENEKLEPTFSILKKYPLWEAVRDQDHARIVTAAGDLFEVTINDSEAKTAEKIARRSGKSYDGSAKEYVHLLRSALDQFQLSDIAVELTDETGFYSRPKHKEKKIVVSNSIHFGYFSMEGGVRHELVHVLRYCNGKFNKIKRSQRFLPTEEGLASWCQDNANDDNGQAQHAMEYVASSVGIKGSLRDIYEAMCDMGMEDELAWKRASRHKFGFIDTSFPGDILKPAMYYMNEQKVAKLSSNEKVRLFVGKINQDELPDHPQYTGIWPTEQLINYFKL